MGLGADQCSSIVDAGPNRVNAFCRCTSRSVCAPSKGRCSDREWGTVGMIAEQAVYSAVASALTSREEWWPRRGPGLS